MKNDENEARIRAFMDDLATSLLTKRLDGDQEMINALRPLASITTGLAVAVHDISKKKGLEAAGKFIEASKFLFDSYHSKALKVHLEKKLNPVIPNAILQPKS